MGGTAFVPTLSLDAGLTNYLAEIRKFPMLRPDQESAYAKRWRERGDREAAYHLVTSHLRLVAKIAMRYRGYGLPIADIISEGNVGLMRAVQRFEPERGFRLATYAMWWIKASIQEYILRSWSLVKMGTSAAQKKLFFKLRKTKAEISALEDGDLGHHEVGRALEHHGDRLPGPHALRDQVMGQAIGRFVQRSIARHPACLDHGRGVRCSRHLLLEQLVDAPRLRHRGPGVVPGSRRVAPAGHDGRCAGGRR